MTQPKALEYKNQQRENLKTQIVGLAHQIDHTDVEFRIGYTQYLTATEETPNYVDCKEGTRLLVGRFCILDDKHQVRINQYNSDDTVLLSTVPEDIAIGGAVALSRVKLIERYGVSVYDLKNLPEEIKNSKFEWTLEIETQDPLLLGEI